MFTTPLRSENRPPIAAKISGVAQRSVAAKRLDQTKTASCDEMLASAAATPKTIPTTPQAIADQPIFSSFRLADQMPPAIARMPQTIGTTTTSPVASLRLPPTGGSSRQAPGAAVTLPG